MFQVLHSWVGSWPYPKILDQAGKACQGQALQRITKIRKLRPYKVLEYLPMKCFSLSRFQASLSFSSKAWNLPCSTLPGTIHIHKHKTSLETLAKEKELTVQLNNPTVTKKKVFITFASSEFTNWSIQNKKVFLYNRALSPTRQCYQSQV